MEGLELDLGQDAYFFFKALKEIDECGRLNYYLASIYSSPPLTSMKRVFFSALMSSDLVMGFAVSSGIGAETSVGIAFICSSLRSF